MAQTEARQIAIGPDVRWRTRVDRQTVFGGLLLLSLGGIVFYLLALIVIQSFRAAPTATGMVEHWGLDGWASVFGERSLRTAALNTLMLVLVRQALSLPIAILLAWLIARSDLPGRNWFEFAFWLSFFLPSLTVTLSWILLLDPEYGLINQALGFVGIGPFNIYSFWGIVWAHLVSHSVSVMVMLLTPIFRNMNSSFEEASRIAGASTPRTILRIFVPIMVPAILAVELIVMMRSLESFEVEQVLGPPFRFQVMTTWIYQTFYQQFPRYDAASALAVILIGTMVLLIVAQQRFIGRRRYTTLTGRFQGQRAQLGRWRWPAFGLMLVVVALIMVVPMVFATMGTFMKLFGYFTADTWTLDHWRTALTEPTLLKSLGNTLILALSAALSAVVLNSLIAYTIVRSRFFGRRLLDFVSWLPFTVPGILLSLALLTMFLTPLFRPLYGSLFVLILASVISGMPLSVQIIKSNLLQLGPELEEASWLTGGNWLQTCQRIVLPLIAPTLVIVGLIAFIGAARNIGQVALLSNSATRPLSMLQLDYMAEGKFEVASVVACIILFLSLVLALLARVFGYRGSLSG